MKKIIKLTSLLLVMAISLCTLFACDENKNTGNENGANSVIAGTAYVIEGNYVEVEEEDLATQFTKVLNSDQMKLMMNAVNEGSLSGDVCASFKMNNLTSIKLDQTEVVSANVVSNINARVGKEIPASFETSRLNASSSASINIDDVLIEMVLSLAEAPADVIAAFKKDYSFSGKEEVYFDGQNIYSNVNVTGVNALLDDIIAYANSLELPADDIAQMNEVVNLIKSSMSSKTYISVAEIIEFVFGSRAASEFGSGSSPIADESIIVTPAMVLELAMQANAVGIGYFADLSNNQFKLKINTTNKTIMAIKSSINEEIAYLEEENAQLNYEKELAPLYPNPASRLESLNSSIDENNATIKVLKSIDITKFFVEAYVYANGNGEIVEAILNYDFDVSVSVPTTQDGQLLNVATKGAFSFSFVDIPTANFVPEGFNANDYTKNTSFEQLFNAQPVL